MPSYVTPSRSRPGPRRRSLLTGAAAAGSTLLLAGCSGSDTASDGRSSAEKRVRARAARDSAELLRRYDAVLAAHASLSDRLGPLRAEVARHEKAFGGTHPPTKNASPDSPGSPAPSAASSSAKPVDVPPGRMSALRFLATAERDLADRRGKQLQEAPAELARLLASVAAAGAAHAYLLTEDDK
ncbi:hypothetical protein [Streptomyces aureocirculatus]|uniref:hypothetical protein n=1 Tax=Streptomyces aureocirculatus TaxID=67275 RepID=UPI0004C7FEF8|nr:hypothetical protein [Streptomyces aureocirculatus]